VDELFEGESSGRFLPFYGDLVDHAGEVAFDFGLGFVVFDDALESGLLQLLGDFWQLH
jgi:hypothetical protein